MGQLPSERAMSFIRPFTYTGLDYAGSFSVSIGRRNEKRWIALFTCLTTRVHLETAKDLSTEPTLMCLANFTNRRGLPIRIRSDHGTNFVSAAALIEKYCADNKIEWLKNTPKDAGAGGCWERLIQIVKKILTVVLCERAPQLETFQAALIDAENIVNSRPLTDVPVSAEDDDPSLRTISYWALLRGHKRPRISMLFVSEANGT